MLDKVIVQKNKEIDASVIWLHGLGADGHDFESIIPELRLPKTAKIRFVFPHAPIIKVTINGGYAMRAWYDIVGEAIQCNPDIKGMQDSVTQVEALIEEEIKLGICPEKIIIAGFSQGGAIALLVGLKSHYPLAGVLALSTYLPDIPNQKNQLNKQIPYLMMHGNSDFVVPIDLARSSYKKLQALGVAAEWCEYPMAHALCQEQILKIADWIKKRMV